VESPSLVGKRLGLMGNASAEEMVDVLQHLEQLTRQRAAKIAGCTPSQGATDAATGLNEQFATALLTAVEAHSIEEFFGLLPHDGHGRIDLCRMFALQTATASTQPLVDVPFEFTAEYVERPSELPPVEASVHCAAERFLLEGEVADERWEADTAAINVLRSAAARGSREADRSEPFCGASGLGNSRELLVAVSRRCTSRRPTLAKAALRALGEGAGSDLAVFREDGDDSCSGGLIQEVLGACLEAARGTKAVARVADETLTTLVRSLAAGASVGAAAEALVETCSASAVKAKPPQALAAAAALRVLLALAPALGTAPGWSDERAKVTMRARAAVEALCSDILATRALSGAFSGARAVQKALPAMPAQTA